MVTYMKSLLFTPQCPPKNAGALDCPSVPLWAVARALQNQNLFARRIRRMEFILSEADEKEGSEASPSSSRHSELKRV